MSKYKLFNGTFYKTKGACRKDWREIVQKTPIHEWGMPLDESTHIKKHDIDFLINNYFDCWDDYVSYKFMSRPVVSFCIKPNGYFNNGVEVLHLEATNDQGFTDAINQDNFSCFGTGYLWNEKLNLNNAFRGAIIKQMCDFKYDHANKVCNVCKQTTKYEEAEADHVKPLFTEIVDNFKIKKKYADDYLGKLIVKGSKLPLSFLKTTGINTDLARYWYYLYGEDQKIHNEFAEYHKKHAILQFLCKNCHKEKTKTENKERYAA